MTDKVSRWISLPTTPAERDSYLAHLDALERHGRAEYARLGLGKLLEEKEAAKKVAKATLLEPDLRGVDELIQSIRQDIAAMFPHLMPPASRDD